MHPSRNAAFVLLSQVLKFLLTIAAIVTVSRILTPAEVGLFAMIAAVLGVGEIFRDFGLSMAAIQARELSAGQQSNLFWLNLLVGLALTGLTVLLAGPVASLYGQPALTGAVCVVAFSFLANSAAAQFRVGLVRRDRFLSLAVVDVSSQAVALVAAIVLALEGAGFWALVLQAVVQSGVALLLVVGLLRWVPGLPNRRGPIRGMLHFGANLLGTQLLSYVGKNIDNVLLGRAWGPTALGYYSRAFSLYSQAQQQALAPFTDLIINTLSRSSHDRGLYHRRVLTVQVLSNYVALAIFGLLIALAEPVVLLLLGPTWGETAVLLRILSIGGLFQVLGNVYYWVFLTEGLTGLHLRITLVSQPIAIAAIIAGLPFGARGVAWGATTGLFIEWLLPATWGASRTSLSIGSFLQGTVRPFLFAAGMALAAFSAASFPVRSPLLSIALGLLAALGWGAFCCLVWARVRSDVAQMWRYGTSALKKRAGAVPVPPGPPAGTVQ